LDRSKFLHYPAVFAKRKKSMNETEFTNWLMEADTPSIRFRTLVDLFGLSANETQVKLAKQAIMKNEPVLSILSRQSKAGNWIGERSYYTPKYTSTHWSLMLLAELWVDGHDRRFQQGVRYMLNTTADELSQQMQTHTAGLSCFWGNLLRYALHADLHNEEQVEKIISYAVMDLQNGPCLCIHNGGKACAWGVVRTLWGLAALPKEYRRPEIDSAISAGVYFLLDLHHLVDADYPTVKDEAPHPLWFRLNFPLFYQVDILFTLRVLDELGMLDHSGVQPALDWLEQQRSQNNRWRGGSPFRQRTWQKLGGREETERWVSLHACRILQHAGRIQAIEKKK
jgi:hypothetical protein